ncbi:MAG: Trk system potassium transporter TrkA [Alphaproteobacteria bacterium]|nr:Trk system potassium transporter TrkA [Alphaproteobacteria bacterium]
MKIIIAGAGQVGVGLAKYLRAENHDIILIDNNVNRLGNLSELLDIQTIEGSSSYPAVLEKAGAGSADIFLAVTGSDETNIVACGVARSVFNVPTRIARIAAPEYLSVKYKSFLQSQGIDIVLSPEVETAHQILESLTVASSVDMVNLAGGQVKLVGLRIRKNSVLIGKKVADLKKMCTDVPVCFVALRRRRKLISMENTSLRWGDDIYVVTDTEHFLHMLDILAYQTISPKYLVVFGGGKVGYQIANILERTTFSQNVTVVEKDEARARWLGEKLNNTLVIHGDGLDDTLIDDLNLPAYQVAIATTQSDESNILLSLLAKRNGVERTCALIHNPLYEDLVTGLGVDLTIEPNAVLVSAILRHIRKGKVKNDYFIQSGIGEVLEVEAMETSKITKRPLSDLKIPDGVVVAGVMRGEQFIVAMPDLQVLPQDTVILFVARGKAREAEKLFTVGFTFF